MPLYEFQCAKCEVEFEELVFSSKPEALAQVTCPECGSHKVSKKVSAIASTVVKGASKAGASAASCAPSGGG